MKLLLLPFLVVAGAAGIALRGSPEGASCPPDCRVTVECTDRGTCIVTCRDESGDVLCRKEIACDGPCSKPCQAASGCER
jgi:hypothetical protein